MTISKKGTGRKPGLSGTLEKRARRVSQILNSDSWDRSIEADLTREISLALDQIGSERALHRDLLRGLLKSESYVWTEIRGLDRRTARYSQYIFPEREKLLSRLQRIAIERQLVKRKHHDNMETLHAKLLSLLNKHAHLTLENGD